MRSYQWNQQLVMMSMHEISMPVHDSTLTTTLRGTTLNLKICVVLLKVPTTLLSIG